MYAVNYTVKHFQLSENKAAGDFWNPIKCNPEPIWQK